MSSTGSPTAGSQRHLLEGLNEAQHRAVVSEHAPLCILAGAGSGKTRVLTRRIAHRIALGSADPRHVLAITFTRKAAGELTKRLGQLGVRDRVATGTFHSVAFNQLRQYWVEQGISAPTLTQSKLRILMPLVAQRQAGSQGVGPGSSVQASDLASEIEWAKARLIKPDQYVEAVTAIGRKPPLGAEAMGELYQRYETDKRRRGIVDFDDLLMLTAEAMETDREFAARQRWRFRHLFVDEFQDVNPAQARLLDGWLGLLDTPMVLPATTNARGASFDGPGFNDDDGFEGDSSFGTITSAVDLCVVGDPNQSIYAWNGADPRFLSSFQRRFPSGGLVRLEDNYRSTPQILTVADAVLGLGARESRPLRPNSSDGDSPTISAYPSDIEEARGIARLLRERHNGRTAWKHMAVLTRTNAQLVLFEEALRAAGIPHRVRGGMAFLQQPEVLRTLSLLNDAPSGVPLSARLNDLEELAGELRDEVEEGSAGSGVPERIDQIEAVIRLAHEYLGVEPHGSTAGFLAWVHGAITSSSDEPDRAGDVVELATFHRAKGLEWPVVFVAGLERGYVPIGNADDAAGRAEEQRLLYVAVTRAERELHCSWAKSRTFGSRTTARSASYWLENIEAAIRSLDLDCSADWQTILRDMKDRVNAAKAANMSGAPGTKRATIEVGAKADPGLYERLKAWRTAESRHSGLPAFTVLHDTSLAAIAEARPSTLVELGCVPGVGTIKVTRYGEALLTVIRETPVRPLAGARRPA
jgi:DNA helicase II / ATP-dependent DNA helicase PcrA